MSKLKSARLCLFFSIAYCQEKGPTGGMPEPTDTGSGQPPSSVVLPSTASNFGYNYTDPKSNQICIRMNASLGLNVTYTNTSGKVRKEMG